MNNYNNFFSFKFSNISISPKKAKNFLKNFRNISYLNSLKILKNLSNKKYRLIWKLLNYTSNTLLNNFNIEKQNIYIKEIYCTKGLTIKKQKAGPRGHSHIRTKIKSHITFNLLKV